MATDALIARLFETGDGSAEPNIDTVLALQDDASLEQTATPMAVADAARLLGLSPHTLRYHEQEGLVRPERNASGHRQYSAHDLRRLVFITRMCLSGMSMRDLARCVGLVEEGPETVGERRRMMTEQRERILRQLRELTLALETTEYKIRTYDGNPQW